MIKKKKQVRSWQLLKAPNSPKPLASPFSSPTSRLLRDLAFAGFFSFTFIFATSVLFDAC